MPTRDLESLLALLPTPSEAAAVPATPPPAVPLLLPIEQVCELLSLSRASVQRLLTSGALRSVQIGRARRVLTSDLQQFVEQLLSVDNSGLGRESTTPR